MLYSALSGIYKRLESTTKTLEKTELLSEFLKALKADELDAAILLLQGRAFPEYDARELGIGTQLVIRAIASASGASSAQVNNLWKKEGDLGETAEELIGKKKQRTLFSRTLTTKKVLENLQKLAELEGAGTVDRKVSLLTALLASADSLSAKYIVRTCLGDLRIGVGAGVLRDAIAQAFGIEKSKVQRAYDLTTDFSAVGRTAKEGGSNALDRSKISIGNPIKAMLYQKAKDLPDAFERVGRPAAVEYKYDGFRLQLHKKGSKVWLFTRRQEDVTRQFPEVVHNMKTHIKANNFILDSEVIGLDTQTGRWLPFQNISQRIRRKHRIEEMVRKIPVIVNIFDVIYFNNQNMIHKPFEERRKLLDKSIKPVRNRFTLAKQIITSSEKEAEKFYREALELGNEGVMVKSLEAEYKPGSRVGYGVKVKPVMESLDLVIVGAEWGTGKRGGWLSSFILACRDPYTNEFLEIGKLGTGIKEKSAMGTSFHEFTKLLKPLIIRETGKTVTLKPKVVVDVAYEEIQRSSKYGSGFALRFPRLVRLRADRHPADADTIRRVKEIFKRQRGQK